MFSKSKDDTQHNSAPSKPLKTSDVPSIIAADLRIVGNLISAGSIEIEGEIEGNVTCGHVTVRRSGKVAGDVIADIVQVDGEINGLVKGKNINVSETGKVAGVIMYEILSIKDGAFIDGQCKSTDKLHRGDVEAIEMADDDAAANFIEEATASISKSVKAA